MAAHLLIVFLAARLAILSQHSLPLSPWTPLAFIYQDVVIVLLFHLFERLVRRKGPVVVVYGALALLAAANVPVAVVLASPLTAPILRAARGALSDSIGHEATGRNIALTASVLALAFVLPIVWHPRARARVPLLAIGALLVLIGPYAARRVDTNGLERNPVVALLRTSIPRVQAQSIESDWRESESIPAVVADLSALAGRAAGSNVLLVVLESTGAQYLRPFGATADPMPNLTALSAQSLVFENAYAVYPESIKELIAMLSSRYPALDVPVERHAGSAAPSLGSVLRAHGYATTLVHSGRFMYLGMDRIVERLGFETTADAGDIGGQHDSSFGVDEPSAVQHILHWIDSLPAQKPFFAAYLPIAGHHPYTYEQAGPFPNERDIDRYQNALFDGDRALGALLQGLRAHGRDRSTLIIVVADHGEAFGQHAGNYGHNLALFEENVHVPLVVRIPGSSETVHVRRPASLLDLGPTVLDLLGVAAESAFQGESLLQLHPRAALFFTDYSRALVGLRDGCLKFIHDLESARSKLFDVCTDPGERIDISKRKPELVRRYRDRLREWSAAQVGLVTR